MGTGAGAVDRGDIFDAGGQACTGETVAELHPRVAFGVLAYDVDLIHRSAAEEGVDTCPRAVDDIDRELGHLRRRGGGGVEVGEGGFGQLEGLERLAAVAITERDLGLGLALSGVGDIAEYGH